jgi:hypothetical protein
VELHLADVAGIADMPSLPEISDNDFAADIESDDFSDLGRAEGNVSTSLKPTECSLKQFDKIIGQPNFGEITKWKKAWVAGFLEKQHRSIIADG